jgi:hypothetical protein
MPDVVLHVPGTWQLSAAVQLTGFVPRQVPFSQVSVRVQTFPSLHAMPPSGWGLVHAPVPEAHVLLVHALPVAHDEEPQQTPSTHVVPVEHATPETQACPCGGEALHACVLVLQ